MPHDDLAWADLPAADDPALAAWLAEASCDPHVNVLVVGAVHVNVLVVGAVHACDRGVSADWGRRDLLAGHPDGSALVAGAGGCMRGAGLWPWHGRVPGMDGADG